jgi:hypothetical protein
LLGKHDIPELNTTDTTVDFDQCGDPCPGLDTIETKFSLGGNSLDQK